MNLFTIQNAANVSSTLLLSLSLVLYILYLKLRREK